MSDSEGTVNYIEHHINEVSTFQGSCLSKYEHLMWVCNMQIKQVKKLKIKTSSIPAKKEGNTFLFPSIARHAVEQPKTKRNVSMLPENQYSVTTSPKFS